MSPYDYQLNSAIQLAAICHAGQQSEHTGEPHICHVMRVMAAGKTDDERIVGALHDIVEDCAGWTIEGIRRNNFSPHICEAVDAITRRGHSGEGETYWDYIERVNLNDLARAVKINDLLDNLARSEGVPGLFSLQDRYRRALFTLQVRQSPHSRLTSLFSPL